MMDAFARPGAHPLIIAASLFFLLILLVTWSAGRLRRHIRGNAEGDSPLDNVNGAVVPVTLGLMSLLLSFTFALAVDRYETRRNLVLEEANALGTAYLQTQLLPEPHRARITTLLTDYTDNRLLLGSDFGTRAMQTEMARNDRLITDLWSATSAAFDDIKHIPAASAFILSMNAVIDLDTSRKVGRQARIPNEVLYVLFFYVLISAGMVGYIVRSRENLVLASIMHLLAVLALALIVDIDRPMWGGMREPQTPMEMLSKSIHAQPPLGYDHWRKSGAMEGLPSS